ncbi:hypothetical protein [Pseudomonas syringae]|uniref:hypothetical protein n=1 Tax=Pseudomonas syringae TaxID=317 RepID=UPI0007109A7D|nr:hypothetical protein [Pseudomonas syringae]
MDAVTIERWIKNLGRQHSELVLEAVIPDLPLACLFIDDDGLQMEPENAIELHFDPRTMRFEEISFILHEPEPSCNDLQSKWPRPAIIAFFDRD